MPILDITVVYSIWQRSDGSEKSCGQRISTDGSFQKSMAQEQLVSEQNIQLNLLSEFHCNWQINFRLSLLRSSP